MSEEDARQLSVLSVMSSPNDQVQNQLECEPESEDADTCTVVKGLMTLMAHKADDLDIIVASILDATQGAMDSGILIAEEDKDRIHGISWLGETLEEVDDALNGVDATDKDIGEIMPIVLAAEEGEGSSDDDGNGILVVFAVGVPLLALLGLAFFASKKNRNVATAAPKPHYIITGTGDPPRSFHEGLYHYTRGGARYLSTNCVHCYETRRNGFFTLDGAESSDWCGLVSPSSTDLGARHSGMDVHECTSATCNICKFRADELQFAGSPRKQPPAPIPEGDNEDDVSDITDAANTNNAEEPMADIPIV